MAPITVTVKSRGSRIPTLPSEVTVDSAGSAADLFAAISAKSRYSVHRLRINKAADNVVVNNAPDVMLEKLGITDRSSIYVKDLGPQLGWRFVYFIEYLGPLLMHPLALYPLRPLLYPGAVPLPAPSFLQQLTCGLLFGHFLKRELETLFIHSFSLDTMPARNIFRNSGHYWLLSGVNVAYWVYSPTAKAVQAPNPLVLYLGLVLYAVGELGNLSNHLTLKNLRKPGSRERGIPRGLGFNWVTCPNYFFEIVAWIGMYLVSNLSLSILFFITIGGGMMFVWAKGKETRYRKLFGANYKKKRFAMIPFVC